MENYKDKSELLLQNLKSQKGNCEITDCGKGRVNQYFKLVKFTSDSLSIKLNDKEEYNKITDYIIKEVDFPNFIFHKHAWNGTNKYLVCQPWT